MLLVPFKNVHIAKSANVSASPSTRQTSVAKSRDWPIHLHTQKPYQKQQDEWLVRRSDPGSAGCGAAGPAPCATAAHWRSPPAETPGS